MKIKDTAKIFSDEDFIALFETLMMKNKIQKVLLKNHSFFSAKELELEDFDKNQTVESSVEKFIENACLKGYSDKLKALGNDIYNEIVQDEAFEDFATKRGITKENEHFLAGALFAFVAKKKDLLAGALIALVEKNRSTKAT